VDILLLILIPFYCHTIAVSTPILLPFLLPFYIVCCSFYSHCTATLYHHSRLLTLLLFYCYTMAILPLVLLTFYCHPTAESTSIILLFCMGAESSAVEWEYGGSRIISSMGVESSLAWEYRIVSRKNAE